MPKAAPTFAPSAEEGGRSNKKRMYASSDVNRTIRAPVAVCGSRKDLTPTTISAQQNAALTKYIDLTIIGEVCTKWLVTPKRLGNAAHSCSRPNNPTRAQMSARILRRTRIFFIR